MEIRPSLHHARCNRILTATIIPLLLACAWPAAAQTGLEGRDYRHPGAPLKEHSSAWPVIATDSLVDNGLCYEISIASDGTWYFVTGSITNLTGDAIHLEYANSGLLPYFRAEAGTREVWSTRYTGPSYQAIVMQTLEPGEQRIYEESWMGQDKQGYDVDSPSVFIEFRLTHRGRAEESVYCPDVPLLPPGTSWLPPGFNRRISIDSWEAAALSTLIDDGVLPGYPAGYFTSQARPGREVILAIAVLNSPSVFDELTKEQARIAKDLAAATGM